MSRIELSECLYVTVEISMEVYSRSWPLEVRSHNSWLWKHQTQSDFHPWILPNAFTTIIVHLLCVNLLRSIYSQNVLVINPLWKINWTLMNFGGHKLVVENGDAYFPFQTCNNLMTCYTIAIVKLVFTHGVCSWLLRCEFSIFMHQ